MIKANFCRIIGIIETQNTQLRVTLPIQLQAYLQSKAGKFGLSLSTYVKNLIINDVKDMDFPEFPMSEKTERVVAQAMKDYQQGKAKVIENVDEYFNNL